MTVRAVGAAGGPESFLPAFRLHSSAKRNNMISNRTEDGKVIMK